MLIQKYNFCPYCGKKIQGLNKSTLNFCCYCGTKLKINNRSRTPRVKCTICHEYINLKNSDIIKCSYCDSQYHSTCITSWLMKYNSCPMCLNVFLMPNLVKH
ncbi:MAG: RING finger domain-containing protein [Promethearchaeota archaeon]